MERRQIKHLCMADIALPLADPAGHSPFLNPSFPRGIRCPGLWLLDSRGRGVVSVLAIRLCLLPRLLVQRRLVERATERRQRDIGLHDKRYKTGIVGFD